MQITRLSPDSMSYIIQIIQIRNVPICPERSRSWTIVEIDGLSDLSNHPGRCYLCRACYQVYGNYSKPIYRPRLRGKKLESELDNFCGATTDYRVHLFQTTDRSDRSRSRSSTAVDPILPLWDVVRDMYSSTGPTLETRPRSCRSYGSHAAAWARSYISYRSYRSGIHLSALKDLRHAVEIDDLSEVWSFRKALLRGMDFSSPHRREIIN